MPTNRKLSLVGFSHGAALLRNRKGIIYLLRKRGDEFIHLLAQLVDI